VDAHTFTKQADKLETNAICQKAVGTCFLEQKRVLMVSFVQQGTIITPEVYYETLKNLRRAIQNERRGMLTSGIVLLHESPHPHTAARIRAVLENFNWVLFDHLRYSLDLAPSDYHLFTYLKNWLG
jgi:histone-lysine N-methyltransferase SETMAR